MKKTVRNILTVSLLTLAFAGCGGGGSSGGDAVGLSFPTNSVAAEPTQANGKEVAQAAVTQDPSLDLTNLALNSVATTNASTTQISNQLFQNIKEKLTTLKPQIYALNETVNETSNCYGGGSMSISGSGSDTGGLTLTVTFNQCYQDSSSNALNGSIRLSASNYNDAYEDYTKYDIEFLTTYTYGNITVARGSYYNQTINTFDLFTGLLNYDLEISLIVDYNGIKYGIKDAFFNYVINPDSYSMTYTQTKGRIYLGNDLIKYVDVDTSYNPPVQFTYYFGTLESGTGHYIMGNNATLEINATGSGGYDVTINNDGNISTQSY